MTGRRERHPLMTLPKEPSAPGRPPPPLPFSDAQAGLRWSVVRRREGPLGQPSPRTVQPAWVPALPPAAPTPAPRLLPTTKWSSRHRAQPALSLRVRVQGPARHDDSLAGPPLPLLRLPAPAPSPWPPLPGLSAGPAPPAALRSEGPGPSKPESEQVPLWSRPVPLRERPCHAQCDQVF